MGKKGLDNSSIAKKYVYDGLEYSPREMKALIERSRKLRSSRGNKCVQMVEGDIILDVGCGIGDIDYMIAPRVSKVVALDILETSIEIAKDFHSLPNIDFIAGDLFKLSFPDNSFDCILCLETIEHIQNPMAFLEEFHRLLKPGGYLILSTPNALSCQNIVYNVSLYFSKMVAWLIQRMNKEKPDTGTQFDHLYSWDFTTLYRLLNRGGFTYADHAFVGFWPLSIRIKGVSLRFPFWTKRETRVMSLLKPFANNLLLKVRKV